MSDRYGIVVDAGSSGSRLQVYKWTDPSSDPKEQADVNLHSVPQIIQRKDWGIRVNPGLSSFANKPRSIWKKHLRPLLEFADTVVPKDKQKDTPIFVQATAGLRLVPEAKRRRILSTVCDNIRSHSDFLLDSCEDQVQVIDGETEGIYGWLALNYLENKFNNFDPKDGTDSRKTFGFMDMGGASTQIAFVPSSAGERLKHADELSIVRMRNLDGSVQEWPIFVSTWLGFGANEARRRHLRNLIMTLPEGVNYDTNGDSTYDLADPCSQKGLKIQQEYKGITYDITGSGDYKQCLRMIYPLLLKHLPCKEDSCLFNGVSAPAIDFDSDRFVGVSEYWYTANDVFHMAGDYNFKQFEGRLKSFCDADWSEVEESYLQGKYGKNIQIPLLRDSCFKASWVVNVLHEGFGLPRIGLEADPESGDSETSDARSQYASPFQSANSINGEDLSWTLGKILLYASSQVPATSYSPSVGIYPSKFHLVQIEQQKEAEMAAQRDRETLGGPTFLWALFAFAVICGVFFFAFAKSHHHKPYSLFVRTGFKVKGTLLKLKTMLLRLPRSEEEQIELQTADLNALESGRYFERSKSAADLNSSASASTLRTRSTMNLQDLRDDLSSPTSPGSPQSWLGASESQQGRPELSHSKSYSNLSPFPPRTGQINNDLMGKRFPRFASPPSATKPPPSLASYIKGLKK